MIDILALDRASVRTKDADGRLHVALVPLTKANVSGYLGSEIPGWRELGLSGERVYQLYREPGALEAAVSTANNLPVLSTHVPVSAEDPHKGLIVGSTGTDAKWADPYITNSLVVWDAAMIKLIESDEQKQISSGYRYTPVMQAGEVDGKKYDGLMTKIIFNHVAIVGEGRVGSDVVIGDSMENMKMKDRNQAGKAKIVADAMKLAQDGKFDALKDFLDAFGDTDGPPGGEEMDVEPPALAKPADPSDPAKPPVAGEGEEPTDPAQKVQAFLRSKLSPEDFATVEKMVAEIGGGDKPEPDKPAGEGEPEKAPEPTTDEDTPEDDKDKEKDMVSKPAMDAAIAAAVQSERLAAKELRDAERFVRPFVGDLAMTFDSADGLLRSAAKAMKIPDADKVHASALRTLITVAGAKPARAPAIALDAAANDEFVKRFPNANRLKN